MNILYLNWILGPYLEPLKILNMIVMWEGIEMKYKDP